LLFRKMGMICLLPLLPLYLIYKIKKKLWNSI